MDEICELIPQIVNIDYKLALLRHAPLIAERFYQLCPVFKIAGNYDQPADTRLKAVCKSVFVAVRRLNIKRACPSGKPSSAYNPEAAVLRLVHRMSLHLD